MSTNKYQPHLLILPEDDAYRDMANGFVKHFAIILRKIQIEKPARGWLDLLECFSKEYVQGVRTYPERHILLLLDLDGQSERGSRLFDKIPIDIKDRVFFLCGLNEAEDIKRELGSGHFEVIGERLAQSCYDVAHANSNSPWLCQQLQYNKDELVRLATVVRPFIFVLPRPTTTFFIHK